MFAEFPFVSQWPLANTYCRYLAVFALRCDLRIDSSYCGGPLIKIKYSIGKSKFWYYHSCNCLQIVSECLQICVWSRGVSVVPSPILLCPLATVFKIFASQFINNNLASPTYLHLKSFPSLCVSMSKSQFTGKRRRAEPPRYHPFASRLCKSFIYWLVEGGTNPKWLEADVQRSWPHNPVQALSRTTNALNKWKLISNTCCCFSTVVMPDGSSSKWQGWEVENTKPRSTLTE